MNKPACEGRLILCVFRSLKDIKYIVSSSECELDHHLDAVVVNLVESIDGESIGVVGFSVTVAGCSAVVLKTEGEFADVVNHGSNYTPEGVETL